MVHHWLGLDLTEKSVPCYIKPSRFWNGNLLTKNLHCLIPVFCSSLAACWGVKGNLCDLLGRSQETPDRRWPQLCLLLPLPCTETAPSWASSGVHSTPSAESFFEHLLGGSTMGQWLEDPLLLLWLLGRFLLASPLRFGKRLEVHLPPPQPWALHGRTEPLPYSVSGASEGTLWAGGQGEREKLTWGQPWCRSTLRQPSQPLNQMSTKKVVRTSYMDHNPLSPTLKQF